MATLCSCRPSRYFACWPEFPSTATSKVVMSLFSLGSALDEFSMNPMEHGTTYATSSKSTSSSSFISTEPLIP